MLQISCMVHIVLGANRWGCETKKCRWCSKELPKDLALYGFYYCDLPYVEPEEETCGLTGGTTYKATYFAWLSKEQVDYLRELFSVYSLEHHLHFMVSQVDLDQSGY